MLTHRYGATRPEFMPDPATAENEETRKEMAAAIKAVAKLPVTGRIPNRGDFTTLKGDEYGAVDALVGGTPCQDFWQ